MPTVLLVEDDVAICEPLTRALGREGYDVTIATNGTEALNSASGADLVILDLGLPDMDGLDVAREIRNRGQGVPIIILTARAEELDMVVGLDAGADDYVTKPFRLAELLARVRALLRRVKMGESESGELTAQDVRMDLLARKVFRGSTELHLTAREFEILKILLANAGKTVSRDELMNQVWGSGIPHTSKTMDMHISWLRRKLASDEAESPMKYIATVRGTGFRFETGE